MCTCMIALILVIRSDFATLTRNWFPACVCGRQAEISNARYMVDVYMYGLYAASPIMGQDSVYTVSGSFPGFLGP